MSARKPKTTTVTTNPESDSPELHCPACHRILIYHQTLISSVRPAERWDVMQCPKCTQTFEYRHRTRKLRALTGT